MTRSKIEELQNEIIVSSLYEHIYYLDDNSDDIVLKLLRANMAVFSELTAFCKARNLSFYQTPQSSIIIHELK